MPQPPEFKTKYLAVFEEEVEGLPGRYASEYGGGVWLAFLPPSPISASNETGSGSAKTGETEGKAVGLVCLKALNTNGGIGQPLPLNQAAELEDAVSEALGHETGMKKEEGERKRKKRSCEPKRLFTTNETRGLGVGRALMGAVIEEAKRFGYEEMMLQTVEKAVEAIRL